MARDRDIWTGVLLRLVGFDASAAIPVAAVWLLLGVASLLPLVLVLSLRGLLWVVYLWRLVEPVRLIQADVRAASDEQLRAADEAIVGMQRRLGVAWALGWVASLPIINLLMRLGVGAEPRIGSAEMVTAALILLGLLAAGSGLLVHVLSSTLLDHHVHIGSEMTTRGLVGRRVTHSLGRTLVLLSLSGNFGCLVGMGAIAGMLHVDGLREVGRVESEQLVERSLDRLALGGEPLASVTRVDEAELPEAIQRVRAEQGDASVLSVHDPTRGIASAAAPLADGQWLLHEAAPDEQLWETLALLLAISLLGSLPMAPTIAAISRAVTGPIEHIGAALRRVVEAGELRGIERVVPLRDDEFGHLAVRFNALLDMLEQLADAASAVASGKLHVELDHQGELHEAFRGMVVRLREMVARIRETSLELASAAAEIHAITAQHEQAAEQQSSSVQQVSEMVVSLAGSAEHITKAASGVLDNAEHALANTDIMVERSAALAEQIGRIGELLEVIREIADRSDLLALNGSLEATRVGEAGRGFALVASEMRRLAERVTGTVSDVRERILDIQASSASTASATAQSRELVGSTAAAARQISAVTQQQSRDTDHASAGVQALAEMVVAAASATSQTRAAAEGLRLHAAELERLTGQFALESGREPDSAANPGVGRK